MADEAALHELEEEYEDSSAEMQEDDQFDEEPAQKLAHSVHDANMDHLTRSQTEPHGDLSQHEYQHKGYKDKHVTTSNNGQSHKSKHKNKSKSRGKGDLNAKHSYKRDNEEDDLDVQSIEVDEEYQQEVLNQTITDEDVYLDMSITAEDYANMSNSQYLDGGKAAKKKSSALDMMASGVMNIRNKLVSPTTRNGAAYSNGSGIGAVNGNHSPPAQPQLTHSSSMHSNQSTGSGDDSGSGKVSTPNSHQKKGSISSTLFGGGTGSFMSKGKLLFGRNNSMKEPPATAAPRAADVSEDEKLTHTKNAGSKTNLSGIKARFQNMKNAYSSGKVATPPSTSAEPKKIEIKEVDKTKKTSSKTKQKSTGAQPKSSSKKKPASSSSSSSSSTSSSSPSKKKKSTKTKEKADSNRSGKNKEVSSPPSKRKKNLKTDESMPTRKRSASSNKNKESDSSLQAPEPRSNAMKPKSDPGLKRHSMNVMRSHSQRPVRKNGEKKSSKNHETAELKTVDHPKLTRKSYSNLNEERLKQRAAKKADAFSMDANKTKSNTLSVDMTNSKAHSRRKSGGDAPDDDSKESGKHKKEKELEESMVAADKKCKYRIKNEIFELYEYYKPIRLVGSGAYAVVCEAIDERTKKRVAIKKNKHIFDDIRDARRILREIKLLLHFTKYKHPDLIEIYDSLPPTVSEIQDFEDVYIVMPLLESNLCKIITSKQTLSNLHYQYLTYQVLRGLKFIHESGVIHRDIKPENILLNGNDCDVKIIDFGLARGVLGREGEDNPESGAKATEYVCTRWYRSPEVMCSGGRYDEKMDIWGVGCILAEMILRRPLFPGANYLDQLQQIFDVMGTPKAVDWILNDQARSWVAKLPKHNGKSLKKMIAHKFDDDEDLEHCTDLLYKLLALNPEDRISASDSLSHPYFKAMHAEDEILSADKFDLSFEFEKSIKTKFGVRHMMYTALDQHHKKVWHKIKKKQKKKEQKEREKRDKEKGGKSSSSKHHHSKHRSSKHGGDDKEKDKHHKKRSSKHKHREKGQ